MSSIWYRFLTIDIIYILGVEIISIAIGNELDWSRLRKYASEESNIFNANDFDAMKQQFKEIAKAMCNGKYIISLSFLTESNVKPNILIFEVT